MPRIRLGVAALLAVLPLAEALAASCRVSETIGLCTQRISDEVLGVQRALLLDSQHDALLKRETGIDTSVAGSALKNLLPLASFSGLLGTAAGAGEQVTSPLGLDLNFPVPDGAVGRNAQLQGETVGQPALAAPLRRMLEDDDRASAIERLERRIAALDDSAIAFTYSFQHYDFGRAFEDYRPRLDALLLQLARSMTTPDERADRALRRRLIRQYADFLPPGGGDFRFEEIDCERRRGECGEEDRAAFDKARQDIMDAVAQAALSSAEGTLALGQGIQRHGLDRFVDLVNNQPLLYLTVRRLIRDPLVGAEATSLKLSYEWGSANLSHFQRRYGAACTEGGSDWGNSYHAAGSACLNAYAQYVREHSATLRDAPRWMLSAEYAEIDDLDIDVAEEAISLHLPGAKRWGGGIAYGRYLALGLPGESRIDASGRYEHLDGPALEGDRYSFSVVLTQKVAGLAIPFTLFYRSHDEFMLDEGDLGALVGLNYDLFGGRAPLPALPPLLNVTPPVSP